jgi:hypothetical protein
MKKFTIIIIVLAFGFGFSYQANAKKEVKPVSIQSPADFTVASGYLTNFIYWIKNTGDEAILPTDSIYVQFGQKNGTTISMQPLLFLYRAAGLAVGDSFTHTFSYTLTGPSSGLMSLVFVAGTHKHTLFGMIVNFDFNVGMADQAKAINKVWYSNSSINYELAPKANCSATLSIFNIKGQMVKNQELNFTAGSLINESISLGTLPKGIYILSVQTPFGVDTKKFVIQ